MNWAGESNAVSELRDTWTRWTALVELYARRRRKRHRVAHETYTQLHNQVIAGCRELASMVEPEDKAFFHQLEKLALPWMTAHSFKVAERDILADLLSQCHKARRDLGGARWRIPRIQKAPAPRLLLALAAVAAGMLFFSTVTTTWTPILRQRRTFYQIVHHFITKRDYVPHLFIPGAIVVAVSSYVVHRSAKV